MSNTQAKETLDGSRRVQPDSVDTRDWSKLVPGWAYFNEQFRAGIKQAASAFERTFPDMKVVLVAFPGSETDRQLLQTAPSSSGRLAGLTALEVRYAELWRNTMDSRSSYQVQAAAIMFPSPDGSRTEEQLVVFALEQRLHTELPTTTLNTAGWLSQPGRDGLTALLSENPPEVQVAIMRAVDRYLRDHPDHRVLGGKIIGHIGDWFRLYDMALETEDDGAGNQASMKRNPAKLLEWVARRQARKFAAERGSANRLTVMAVEYTHNVRGRPALEKDVLVLHILVPAVTTSA